MTARNPIRTVVKTRSVNFAAVVAIGLMTAAIAPAASAQAPQMPPAVVEVADATSKTMAPSIETPGTVVSLNDSRISAEIAGRIVWVAPEGSNLKEGDVLARIEDRDMAIAVCRWKATITRMAARLKFLTSELERANRLVAQGNAAESRAQQAESDLVTAEQDLVDAKLQLELAELNAARTLVQAPFPGRVVERFAQAGEYAAPGRELARLVDTENLEVQTQAPVRLSPFVGDGSTVDLIMGSEHVESSIRAIIPVGDEISRTMALRVTLPVGHGLVVGSAVNVALPAALPADVIAVPRDALVLRADGTYVFRIKEDGTAERIRVQTGASHGTLVAVADSSIAPGDRVVIRGGERLRPGQPTQVSGQDSGDSLASR